jgi:hypothetical protein
MFLKTFSPPSIFSEIKKEAVKNALIEQRTKLHDKRLKQKADGISKKVI